jgi:hypothetical protein
LLAELRNVHQVKLDVWKEIRSKYDEKYMPTDHVRDHSFAALSNWQQDFYEPISKMETSINLKNELIEKL